MNRTIDVSVICQSGESNSGISVDFCSIAGSGSGSPDMSNYYTKQQSDNRFSSKDKSVPSGGAVGQVLAKKSNTDNDLEWVNQSGGGGTDDYENLDNLPSINSVTLIGNKSFSDLTDGLLFGGQINTQTVVQPDTSCYYLLEEAGYYSAFGVNVYGDEHLSMLVHNGTSWVKQSLYAYNYGYCHGKFETLADIDSMLDDIVPSTASSSNKLSTASDVNGKLSAPATAGTSGQVLTSDGQGGQSWQTPTSGVSSYNDLPDKPQINSVTLSGNKTLSQLGIQSELTFDNIPTDNSNNPVKSGGVKTALDSKQDTLVSGTSIKTVNNTSLLGSGNIQINDGVGFQTITTQQDGTMQITLTNGDTITIDLNHTHEDKQDVLVSGTNIKTINNESLLGSGNITIQGGGGDVNVIEVVKVNGTALTPDQNKAVDVNAVTNITMNNISQTVSNGVVNLGTVITSLSGYAKYEFVNSLPASPQSDTLYLIPVS